MTGLVALLTLGASLAAPLAVEDLAIRQRTRGAPPLERSTEPLLLDLVDPTAFDLPIVRNDAVECWMEWFLDEGRPVLEKWLWRADHEPWDRRVAAALEAEGLPRDLRYQAMIESGLVLDARSPSDALGLWQILPATAVDLGLRVDDAVDERLDPERSTAAALDYLALLHDRYDDWHLALAAYNGGMGTVDDAMVAAGTDDYWVLADGWLSQETSEYVPKIVAVAIIARYRGRYGFPGPSR